jgi:hypothetical protein
MDESRARKSREWNLKLVLSVYGAILATVLTGCIVLLTVTSHRRIGRGDLHGIQETASFPRIPPSGYWRFIVSGDSRNCGDVVMPAIATHSAQFAPSFYWHLGDLRAIYKIDEDMAYSAAYDSEALSCENYHKIAYSDFIENQIAAFGHTPFYLGIGNHEVIPPKSEETFKHEFADWLDQDPLRQQRQKDGEADQTQTYYHWIQGGVDFIYLDNASNSFSPEEVNWFQRRLDNAKVNSEVKSLVVGMHEALPGSLANSHSMGNKGANSPGTKTGTDAYNALIKFRDDTHKPVYVLASHSHFYMENIFAPLAPAGKGVQALPGWIVGTAGAIRYALPADATPTAMTDVYGYLLGTVATDGTIQFSFQKINESDIPQHVRQRYTNALIPWCFAHNSQNRNPVPKDVTSLCPVGNSSATEMSH